MDRYELQTTIRNAANYLNMYAANLSQTDSVEVYETAERALKIMLKCSESIEKLKDENLDKDQKTY